MLFPRADAVDVADRQLRRNDFTYNKFWGVTVNRKSVRLMRSESSLNEFSLGGLFFLNVSCSTKGRRHARTRLRTSHQIRAQAGQPGLGWKKPSRMNINLSPVPQSTPSHRALGKRGSANAVVKLVTLIR